MISRYSNDGLTWVDVESPSAEEVSHVLDEFSLPGVIGEEIVSSTLRSKVDLYDNFIYLIFHFPAVDQKTGRPIEQEIDFVIGKNFLITVRYEPIIPVLEFAKQFEASTLPGRSRTNMHAGYIFMDLMQQFYKASLRDLENLTLKLRGIEEHIFSGHEEAVVKELSATGRKLLDFKQAIRFHRDILQSYESASKRFFGDEYMYYASIITSEFNKVNNLLESHRDVLTELQRTNDSLLSTKQNEILRTFTIMTFMMVPLTLITGIYGMNMVPELIFIRDLKDFYFIISAMFMAIFVMLIFFRRKRWL